MREKIESDLRQIRYIIAAVEYGSFHKVAEYYGVKVSTVSRRIRDLEVRIGVALFIRDQRGVRLTHAGELFLRHARHAVQLIRTAEIDVSAIARGEHGLVRVGLSSSLASTFLAALMTGYTTAHPKVRLEFVDGNPADHIQAIRRFQLDLAFVPATFDVDNCESANLWAERLYVVMPNNDRLAALDQVGWEDLHGRHFVISQIWLGREIHDFLVVHLAKVGHRPSIELQAVYQDTLMQIVASGRGLTLASEARVAVQFPGVVYRALAEEQLPYCAIWSRENNNPASRHLLDLALKLAVRNLGSRPPNGPLE